MESQRYEMLVQEVCDGNDPYTVSWYAEEVAPLPRNVTREHIEEYFLGGVSAYSGIPFDSTASLRAENQYESGFLLRWMSLKFTKYYVIVGSVRHSQKMNAPPLKAWVAVSSSGKVEVAHCNCKSGLGETCSHAAVILFALADLNLKDGNKKIDEVLMREYIWVQCEVHVYVSVLGFLVPTKFSTDHRFCNL